MSSLNPTDMRQISNAEKKMAIRAENIDIRAIVRGRAPDVKISAETFAPTNWQ